MDYKTVALIISDELSGLMEERGINEDDIRAVLEYAEAEGKKMYVEGEERFLAKKRLNNFTVNVEYVLKDGGVELLNAYSHIVLLAEDQ